MRIRTLASAFTKATSGSEDAAQATDVASAIRVPAYVWVPMSIAVMAAARAGRNRYIPWPTALTEGLPMATTMALGAAAILAVVLLLPRIAPRATWLPMAQWCVVLAVAFIVTSSLYERRSIAECHIPVLVLAFGLLVPGNAVRLWRQLSAGYAQRQWGPALRLFCAVLAVATVVESIRGRLAGWPTALALLPLILNAGILCALAAIPLALTRRFMFSLSLALVVYLALVVLDLFKIWYMSSSVQWLDTVYLPELLPYLKSYAFVSSAVGVGLLVLLGAGLRWAWRRRPEQLSALRRCGLGLGAAAFLALMAIAGALPGMQSYTAARLGLSQIYTHWNSVLASCRSGLLLGLCLQLPSTFVAAPPAYSQAEVAASRQRLGPLEVPGHTVADLDDPPSIIIYVVESMCEPGDLDLTPGPDLLPNIHAASKQQVSGRAIVPRAFGGTAETEFEILTGMSYRFLPPGSCAYKQFLKHDIPSLPRTLRTYGFHTTAVYADPASTFNRRQACAHLGFDAVTWLGDREDVPRDVAGRFPSDAALVDEVIRATDAHPRSFVFALTGSTHWPWNYSGFGRFAVHTTAPPTLDQDEVNTYLSAVRVADDAIGGLLAHYRQSDRKVIVVVLGDHRPPLKNAGSVAHGADRYSVPLLVWRNYGPHREAQDMLCGTSFLAARVLEEARIPPTAFLAVNSGIAARITAYSDQVTTVDGTAYQQDGLPDWCRSMIHDYRLLQYDLLFGRRFSWAPAERGE